MTHEAKVTIEFLMAEGYSTEQIKTAMCDGEILGPDGLDLSQDVVEEIYNSL